MPFGAIPALVVLVGVPAVLIAALLRSASVTEMFEVLWQMEQQRRVPAELLARVTSYDMLGSYVAIPVGQALAAPVASLIGLRPALVGAGVIGVLALASCLLVKDVRAPAPHRVTPGTPKGGSPEGEPPFGTRRCELSGSRAAPAGRRVTRRPRDGPTRSARS